MERGVVQLVVATLWPLVLPKLLELRVRPPSAATYEVFVVIVVAPFL
jgi:hypothetical protein